MDKTSAHIYIALISKGAWQTIEESDFYYVHHLVHSAKSKNKEHISWTLECSSSLASPEYIEFVAGDLQNKFKNTYPNYKLLKMYPFPQLYIDADSPNTIDGGKLQLKSGIMDDDISITAIYVTHG